MSTTPAPATLNAARRLLGLTVTTTARPGMYHAMKAATADDGTVTLDLMDTDGAHFTVPADGAEVTDTDRVHYAARTAT
ncbi:hypothetical protein [Streptomyces sp. NPDC088727]|uniref:hypothetical protein n=1 Tax=Streptomyces sp. NPDC088727 TaxID=3365875 RepID=UPI0038222670